MKFLTTLLTATLCLGLSAEAWAQSANDDYIVIGGSNEEPQDTRWVYTWWDERGVFHGVDSLDLVPLVYRDRAERTRAIDVVLLDDADRVDERRRDDRQRLRPNLPDASETSDPEEDDGVNAQGKPRRAKTYAERSAERGKRLDLLRSQLRNVEEQLAALEEGSVPTSDPEDLELTDAQLEARLTHLETRYEYLTGEIKVLESEGS